MSDPIIFGQPHFSAEEIDLVTETIRSGWIGQGPLVQRFEEELARYVWADHVVAVSSCTVAIELALRAAGIGDGDEVITTPLTFVATVNAIESTGASVRLVDIDPSTLLLTPAAVESALTDRVRAVVPVSFGGRPLDLAGYLELADAHDLWVIEDAAHTVGAVADGLPVGASRHERLMTCFSFYPNKNLASAEGGAITLGDPDRAGLLHSARLHGLQADAWRRYRDVSFHPSLATMVGFKANWTDVQAAIALPQLRKLEGFLATREFLAQAYDDLLVGAPNIGLVERPAPSLTARHALHLYQVRVPAERRDEVIGTLRQAGIGAALHYTAVHHHPYFERLGGQPLPHADLASRELISLPLHPGLHLREVERVSAELRVAVGDRGGSPPSPGGSLG